MASPVKGWLRLACAIVLAGYPGLSRAAQPGKARRGPSPAAHIQAAVGPVSAPPAAPAPAALPNLWTRPEGARFSEILPDGQALDIRVIGQFSTELPRGPPQRAPEDSKIYDAVIVGGGLAGLSAAWHLRDKDILVLERSGEPGGLASQGSLFDGALVYARGSAYYTEPEGEVAEIYRDMGLPALDKTAIREPIDSLFADGRLVRDLWGEGLSSLPPGFAAFKKELQRLGDEGTLDFDPGGEMPEASRRLDATTAARFLKPYGAELSSFLDSYSQSALGGHLDQISALAFLYFYYDEIATRYAWPGGTGGASAHLVRNLLEKNPAMIRTGASVSRVVHEGPGVKVSYESGGLLHEVRARQAVVAAPLKAASRMIPEMPAKQRRLIDSIAYAHYIVHNVFSSGHHYRESYDTWFPRSMGMSFTDVIAGRWVESGGFSVEPAGPGLLTVYMPLAPPQPRAILVPERVAALAKIAAVELRLLAPGLAAEPRLSIESSRWPSSIHLARPGFLSRVAPRLTAPIGRIRLAHSNQGTPNFENALVRGRRAALEVRGELEKPGS